MGQVFEGGRSAAGRRFAVASARFNEFIVKSLVDGARGTLLAHGCKDEDLDLASCAGAMELPLLCKRLAESGRYDAVVAVGCVIRGGTPHFEYVAGQAAAGLARVALDTGVPVAFGVLTVESIEQAIERAGTKMGNKGAEAALAAIEMADLLPKIPRAGARS
jgi:6,7-dimethyl-8-ribityllumazine synthase